MATFEPTEAEKASESYLDWSDESLAKLARYIALELAAHKDDETGLHRITSASCAALLIGCCHGAGAATLSINVEGHSSAGIETGDWRVTVERIKAP